MGALTNLRITIRHLSYVLTRCVVLFYPYSFSRPRKTLPRLLERASISSGSRYPIGPSKCGIMSLSWVTWHGSESLGWCSLWVGLTYVILRYFLKAIEWARKYGIRINLDFRKSGLCEIEGRISKLLAQTPCRALRTDGTTPYTPFLSSYFVPSCHTSHA